MTLSRNKFINIRILTATYLKKKEKYKKNIKNKLFTNPYLIKLIKIIIVFNKIQTKILIVNQGTPLNMNQDNCNPNNPISIHFQTIEIT
jgi:hypothetical protein